MGGRKDRRAEWGLGRPALEALQLERLNELLAEVVPASPLYRSKLGPVAPRLASLAELAELPLTTKEDLVEGAAEGAWRTRPDSAYVRYHQTSGTHGRPLAVLDTARDWRWWIDTWQHVLDAARVEPGEGALLAFSFGPFIGFWSAFEALAERGVLVLPGGGMNGRQRLELIERMAPSLLFCTPTYALHLAEEARSHGIDPASTSVTRVVVAGEPGGSAPATRTRIARAWAAEVVDHAGATEVGPWGFGDNLIEGTPSEGPPRDGEPTDYRTPGVRVIETEFIAEFLSVETGKPAAQGELSHLVITPLGRHSSPVVRYRTGDLARPHWPDKGACRFVRLEGGVLGRADDMAVVRGVNVFPSALDEVLHGFPEVVEHRTTVVRRGEMDELVVEVEDHLGEPARIADELHVRLGLRVEVRLAPAMSLPRSEGKSRRFFDKR
ncbi:MAG: phenylacetate--CoA ligase family protein [Lacipirellulaceae bacterium]